MPAPSPNTEDVAPERRTDSSSAASSDMNGQPASMSPPRKRLYPFNAEQTVNILSEFGPLVTMFVVNAMYGINAGTWALILDHRGGHHRHALYVPPPSGVPAHRVHGHHRLRRADAHHA